MAEFTLYVQLLEDESPDDVEDLFGPFVDEYDSVAYEASTVDSDDRPGVVVPEKALAIDDIDAFAEVFQALHGDPAVHDLSLWGPGSSRFPVRAYHHALRSLSDPDRYQFHALDNRETLVICDTPTDLQQAREDLGPAGLAAGGNAKF
ncbi:hypothetical protein [Natronomonas moolapensis]|nr:hypothetical protein [Natronomonas moolapensis]